MKQGRRGGLVRMVAHGMLGLLALQGCRFETRAPSGSTGDEAVIQSVVAGYYRALSQRDTTALDTLTFGAATVLVAAGRAEPSLVPWRVVAGLPERRTAATGVRVVRTDLRLDGDFASVRVVIAGREATGVAEFEATDLLTLARRSSGWHVAHLVEGTWRPRSAP